MDVDVVEISDGECRKPVLFKIVKKIGLPVSNVRINYNVPPIDGFLPIESQDVDHATEYIALDNIASFTVLDERVDDLIGVFPVPRARIKIDSL